jgi:hypothetical protein
MWQLVAMPTEDGCMVSSNGAGGDHWPTETIQMGPTPARTPDPRRRFWRRLVIGLAVLVAATMALVVYLLVDDGGGSQPDTVTQVTELRNRAVGINQTWDEQESELSDADRAELYAETEAQLETLLVDTRAFNDEIAAVTSDQVIIDAAADMVAAAEQMLDGLRVPGRTNKDLRLDGLDLFELAAETIVSRA